MDNNIASYFLKRSGPGEILVFMKELLSFKKFQFCNIGDRVKKIGTLMKLLGQEHASTYFCIFWQPYLL